MCVCVCVCNFEGRAEYRRSEKSRLERCAGRVTGAQYGRKTKSFHTLHCNRHDRRRPSILSLAITPYSGSKLPFFFFFFCRKFVVSTTAPRRAFFPVATLWRRRIFSRTAPAAACNIPTKRTKQKETTTTSGGGGWRDKGIKEIASVRLPSVDHLTHVYV